MRHTFVNFLVFAVMLGCTTPSIIATRSIQEGDRMNNENRYDEAIMHYKEYLELSPRLGLYRNASQEAQVCRKLAHAYATQGKYRESFLYLKKALGADSTLSGNRLEMIDDYRELGVVKAYMGDYPEALAYLNKSLALNEGMEKSAKDIKKSSLADTYLSLARVNLTLGNFKEAGEYGGKAVAIYGKIADETGTVEANLLLGIVSRERGELEEAIRAFTSSSELARRQGLNTARQHQALGEVYFIKGESETGIRYQMLAIQEAERSRIKPQILMMYMRMGDAWQKLGDVVKAQFYYQRAMSVKLDMDADSLSFVPAASMRFAEAEKAYQYYARAGATMGTALVSLRLGELRLQQNDADSALIMFSAAKKAFEKAGSKEGMAKANLELGKMHAKKKNHSVAMEHLRQARGLTSQPDLAWQIELAQGSIEESTGVFDSAYHSYKEAITIIDRMRSNFSIEEFKTLFANQKVEVYDRMIALLFHLKVNGISRQQAMRNAFEYNEQSRSRTFLDMLGNKKIEPKDIADTALLEREQLLRLKIQQLSRQQNLTDDITQQRSISSELERTYREFDQVISSIKLNNPAYATVMNVNPPGVEEVQASLDHETALVEYWVSERSLFIWVVTKDSLNTREVVIGKDVLQRLLKGCRNGISFRDTEITQSSLRKLHSVLIASILEHIKTYKNLVIVPHRSLHFLPFQALISAENSFLIEEFTLTYAPASSIFYYCQRRETAPGENFLGMALGDHAIGKHSPLPGTRSEVSLLSQLYPHFESKYEAACDETYVKNNIGNFNYVHIATHGVFNEVEPVYSYLLLNPTDHDDGQLTVNEIFGLDIESRLVTLSACETALGELSEGDELVGLSRAFIYAGSAAVLVSLWKVEDSSTALLMARLHQYVSAGNSPAKALSLAQRDLIHKSLDFSGHKSLRSVDLSNLQSSVNMKTLDNPFFWAPFVIVGNGQVK